MLFPFLWTILSIIAVIVLTSRFKLNSFIALFLASLLLGLLTLAPSDIVPILKDGFGYTMSSIGLIIIFGTLIGVNLQKSGAAQCIANFILSKTGNKRATLAIQVTGFLTGLPIFCDSGFIILNGISQSFARKAKVSMPIMAAVLGTSLYAVHCLIPPHPGATAAAGIMNVNLGNLMLVGVLIAIPVSVASYIFIRLMSKWNRKSLISETPPLPEIQVENRLPHVSLSFLPILIPLLLITGKSMLSMITSNQDLILLKILFFIGDPIIALLIGASFSFMLIDNHSKKHINELFSESIDKAGPILIIIAAGGMFGAVIKATGVGEAAGEILAVSGLGLLIPFLITSILKTAQGSSTVAIITTASIVSPMLASLGLDSENGRLLATLSMGAGSMMISHANDAYFWVITRFAGIDPNDTLKYYSTSTIVIGFTSIAIIYGLQFVLL